MRTLAAIACLALTLGWEACYGSTLSFQEWKVSRVEEAQRALTLLQKPLGAENKICFNLFASKHADAQEKGMAVDLARQIEQAQLNIEIAQELSINDYFILYLSRFNNRKAFEEVAQKLTPPELAELLLAYKKSLLGAEASSADTPPSVTTGFSSLGGRNGKLFGL